MAVNLAEWLSFSNPNFSETSRNEFRANYIIYKNKEIESPEALDFADFGTIREGKTLREFDRFCQVSFRVGSRTFTSQAWNRLFRIQEPIVREYVYEFLSSVKFRDHTSELELADTLVFQLGGVRRSMTLREFTLALGLYTNLEMNNNLFAAFRENYVRNRPYDYKPFAYFVEISTNNHYDPRHPPSYTTIKTPIRRLAHRLLTLSITGRHHAKFLVDKAKGSKRKSMIYGAHLISRIAMYYGLMAPEFLMHLTVEFRMSQINVAKLVDLGICKYNTLGRGVFVANLVSDSEDEAEEAEGVEARQGEEGVRRRLNMSFTNRLTTMDNTLVDVNSNIFRTMREEQQRHGRASRCELHVRTPDFSTPPNVQTQSQDHFDIFDHPGAGEGTSHMDE
ncbi:hypothetical protein Tco_1092775 [Tanacetum coccineum]|uniref:Uncharacterized protein n=1 Tax=Tanacetum coccineum TaxID=301880 RepID=A0ABQ5ICU2_9ASTR